MRTKLPSETFGVSVQSATNGGATVQPLLTSAKPMKRLLRVFADVLTVGLAVTEKVVPEFVVTLPANTVHATFPEVPPAR